MTLLFVLLWLAHGALLLRGWGRFRPRIAALHGLAMGLLGAALTWGLPALPVLAVAGGLIGLVGALGHPLAPGLWLGVGLVWLAPWVLPVDPTAYWFNYGAIAGAALVTVARSVQSR